MLLVNSGTLVSARVTSASSGRVSAFYTTSSLWFYTSFIRVQRSFSFQLVSVVFHRPPDRDFGGSFT